MALESNHYYGQGSALKTERVFLVQGACVPYLFLTNKLPLAPTGKEDAFERRNWPGVIAAVCAYNNTSLVLGGIDFISVPPGEWGLGRMREQKNVVLEMKKCFVTVRKRGLSNPFQTGFIFGYLTRHLL